MDLNKCVVDCYLAALWLRANATKMERVTMNFVFDDFFFVFVFFRHSIYILHAHNDQEIGQRHRSDGVARFEE